MVVGETHHFRKPPYIEKTHTLLCGGFKPAQPWLKKCTNPLHQLSSFGLQKSMLTTSPNKNFNRREETPKLMITKTGLLLETSTFD